mgnify:CR=1 FL=1
MLPNFVFGPLSLCAERVFKIFEHVYHYLENNELLIKFLQGSGIGKHQLSLY